MRNSQFSKVVFLLVVMLFGLLVALIVRSAVIVDDFFTDAFARELVQQFPAFESRFCEAPESAPGRLEKPSKNPIYSIAC